MSDKRPISEVLREGASNANWKGGRMVSSFGYQLVQRHGHHRANRGGYVREHILVVEDARHGRPLPDGAVIHHVDGNRRNNAASNLVVCDSHAYHMLLHVRAAAIAASGDPRKRHCTWCREWDDTAKMRTAPSRTGAAWEHAECRRAYDRAYQKERARRIKRINALTAAAEEPKEGR